MSISIELVRKIEPLDPVLKDVLYTFISEIEKNREESVSKREFNELSEIVKNLAVKVGELAISQKELAISQKELAEAQKRTEERLDRLTIKVEELVDAQKKTESSLQELIKDHQETRKMLGGLSQTVGFSLENEAYKVLPELLKRDFNIKIKEKLIRKYLTDIKGREMEINIFGKASRDEKDILIIGEGKCHLSKNDIEHFIKSRLRKLQGLYKEEIFPVMVTHMTTGMDVEEHGKNKGIAIYYSYDF